MPRCEALTQKKRRCLISAHERVSVADQAHMFCFCHLGILSNGGWVTLWDDPSVQIKGPLGLTSAPLAYKPPTPIQAPTKPSLAPPPWPASLLTPPKPLPPSTECLCCFEEIKTSELVFCRGKKDHGICRGCVRGYVESQLAEGNASLTCMIDSSDHCGGRYPVLELQKFLQPAHYQMVLEQDELQQVAALAVTLDNFHSCPFCLRFGLVVPVGVPTRTLDCARCRKRWCLQCRSEDHGRDPCERIRDVGKIPQIVANTITQSIVHRCPHCHTKYTKSEGCNLMTCPRCHGKSCYICGVPIKERQINGKTSFYYHFKGSGNALPEAQCPLYNDGDNVGYNQRKTQQALWRLLDINDKPIRHLIAKEISRQGIDLLPRSGGCCCIQ